jgi:uncharacterized protein
MDFRLISILHTGPLQSENQYIQGSTTYAGFYLVDINRKRIGSNSIVALFDAHIVLPTLSVFLMALFLCTNFSFQDNSVVAALNVSGNNNSYSTSANSTVFATGSAFTRLAPDRVLVSIGVESTDKTAKEALSVNSEIMNSVISDLRSIGLKSNETRTSFFNIFPLYNYTESGTRLNVTGFTVTNTIQIESSNLNNVSQWVDTAVAAGANSIDSIDFSVTEKKLDDARSKLITDAIDIAKQKAEVAASAVQLSITGVESLVIDGTTNIPPVPPQPFFRETAFAQGGTSSPSTPIIPGEQEVSVSVSGIFSMG